MFKSITDEQFLKKLKDLGVMYIPLEEYKGSTIKIKWMCYKNSKHIFEASPDAIYRSLKKKGCICPYCNKRKVFVGETDMWTTNPEIALMLENPDDGYVYFATSSKRTNFICPRCGARLKDKVINNVRMFGLSCDNCSDGISFGEKFVYELLLQLDCNFVHDKITEWSNGRRYDFYIPSIKTIIETHGIQHYEDGFINKRTRSVEEEKQNDNYKKSLALSNGIEHYIQLDCKKSDYSYIKNSIVNSQLNEIFDLSNVDWHKCFQATFNSNIMICVNLWNDGTKSIKDIANCTGIDRSSVLSYIKRASKIGLCDYVKNRNKNRSRYKRLLCIETGKIYEYISDVKDDGYDKYYISKCLHHKNGIAYGMHWQLIN